MKIVLSSRAVADLAQIARFIEHDNPPRARSFVAELRRTVQRLADMPYAFPLLPRYERYGIRRRSWKGYGILYAPTPGRIFIYRVVGPGQDHDRALGLR